MTIIVMIALLQAKVDFVLKYFWEFTLKILPKKNNLSSVITYLFIFVIFRLFALFRDPNFIAKVFENIEIRENLFLLMIDLWSALFK